MSSTPVERLGLVAQHVARLARLGAFGHAGRHRKGVVGVVGSGGHGQADDQRGAVIESAGREHQKRVDVAHFLPGLGVAVDPDHILALRHP